MEREESSTIKEAMRLINKYLLFGTLIVIALIIFLCAYLHICIYSFIYSVALFLC